MALVLAGLLVVACGADPAAAPSPDDSPDGQVLEGTLAGNAELEGGCAWLEADQDRYDVLYPDGYEIAFDPVRLLGPDGATVAADGEVVRVRGQVADDLMTVCQVGTVFRADEVLSAS